MARRADREHGEGREPVPLRVSPDCTGVARADLAKTAEVRFTQEIRDLATQLAIGSVPIFIAFSLYWLIASFRMARLFTRLNER